MMISEHYEALIEQMILCEPISERDILSFARYKKGKSYADIKPALERGYKEGRGYIEKEFECMAKNLSEILNVNLNIPLPHLRERLRAL